MAAVHVEDRVSPKRCGHVAGRQVIARDATAGNVRAAPDNRRRGPRDYFAGLGVPADGCWAGGLAAGGASGGIACGFNAGALRG